MVMPFGVSVKVLHGCRQLVPSGVGLSAITSATPFRSWLVDGFPLLLNVYPQELAFIVYCADYQGI